VGPDGDVDDLAQEVFMRMFDRVHTVQNPQALAAFVLTTATRAAQSELRRRRVRRIVALFPGGELPMVSAGSGPDSAAREAVGRFYALLERLAPAEQTAFVLRHIEGLELTEVAMAMGVSLATVKRRLERVQDRVTRLVSQDRGLDEYVAGLRGSRP
jgi:RNA polymerase sigma-70 factor (ECF subfamily)